MLTRVYEKESVFLGYVHDKNFNQLCMKNFGGRWCMALSMDNGLNGLNAIFVRVDAQVWGYE